MINPYLSLSGLGMILVGVFAVLYWRWKTKVSFHYFFLGMALWSATMLIKVLLDHTVTPLIARLLSDPFKSKLLLSFYLGLRTGILEVLLVYLILLKMLRMEVGWNEAVAFGIGFGSLEAVILGFSSLTTIITFTLKPELLQLIPPAQREVVESQLSMSSLVIPAPIMERFFTLYIHVFASVLIFSSLIIYSWSPVTIAFIFKTVVDTVAGYYAQTGVKKSIAKIYYVEALIGIFWIISFIGLKYAQKRLYNI